MSVELLTEMSHKYGTVEYAIAGGGNTSYKDEDTLYVKGSGSSLADITPEQFVAMDLGMLRGVLTKKYPEEDAAREAAALADMMAARRPGEQDKRPSVECLLHAIFPHRYVLHVHPALINGLTCAVEGEELCAEIFGGKALWIPLTKPGYTLAAACGGAFSVYEQETGAYPQIVILQNHGIFIAADTTDEIDAMMAEVAETLEARIKQSPVQAETGFDADLACKIAPALRMLYSPEGHAVALFCANALTDGFVRDRDAMKPLIEPFSPDHIVYCRDTPLFLEPDCDYAAAFAAYKREKGYAPKIAAVRGLGFFALGKDVKEAQTAKLVFLDAMKIAVYADSFRGYLPLPAWFTDFILHWEAENYRQKALSAGGAGRRLDGRIAIVTGGAQGIGQGIAGVLAREGAYVVIADLNKAGAEACAEELNKTYGPGKAAAAGADVTDEQSVKRMVDTAVLAYGGLDIFISNAGILFAGGLSEMTRERFELVAKVNYTGYFLGVKYAVAPMKIQRAYSKSYTADIVEVNSKSGLTGSNKNFAYAGSKFGGIGLTQSFALELVDFGIKVNAVCPGNILDGPLWSDPEKGLFRQYLDTGKVPGAKTVADVRRFYEDKVPMKRGCRPEDVARAILYAIEQQYETGQAIPVTGGQIMK